MCDKDMREKIAGEAIISSESCILYLIMYRVCHWVLHDAASLAEGLL